MAKKAFSILIFLFLFSAPLFSFAQTAALIPASRNLLQNQRFDLNLEVSSVTDLAGVSFDLQYNPSLVAFLEAADGGFLSGGSQISMAATGNAGGFLSFNISRLSGAVSGGGTVAKLSFRTLAKQGETALTFVNNSFCVLSGGSCVNAGGSWQGANLKILNSSNDATAPTTPAGLSLVAVSSTAVKLSWEPSTDEIAVAGYNVFRDNKRIATVSAANYTDEALSPNSFYSFAVSAFDETGNESFQAPQASIKTPEASAASVSTSTPSSTAPTLQDLQKQIQELIKLVAQLQLRVLEFLKARGR